MIGRFISWQTLLDLGWLIFLLIVFKYFLHHRKETLKAKDWIKAKGRITHCEWSSHGHSLWPKIEYIYQVGDIDYTGQSFFLDTAHVSRHSKHARQMAFETVMSFKKNEDVVVYYDPNQPKHAVLDTYMPQKINVTIGIVSVLIVLHLTLVIFRIMT